MTKSKTKKAIVLEMIDSNKEEIIRMEIVRDFNLLSDHSEAKVQVDAANNAIKKAETQIAFLEGYLKTL